MRMLPLVLALLVLVLSGVGELMACQATASKTALEKLNDDTLTRDVQGKLAADNVKNMNRMSFSQVEVHTDRGIVTLSGVVQTSDEKTRAEQLAGQINGIKHIINNIEVPMAKQR